MLQSKSFALFRTLLMLAFAVVLIAALLVKWDNFMQTDPTRLFILMLLTALCIYRFIDYLLKWRNWGKHSGPTSTN
jgi:sterol desaturase/sphingolipid hydroxylase (fatty acid hydroxylase superfamily)